MTDKAFADGCNFFPPRQGAPDFVVGSLSIRPKEFMEFLQGSGEFVSDKGFLALDIKKSQKGTYYVEVNTYRKENKTEDNVKIPHEPSSEQIHPDDIPF